MGSFTRFTRYMKDFWKVFIRGENEDLRRQTISMQEELARLRNRRMASDKEREAAALNQARGAVQRLRELHDSFLAAEVAASEFAAKMGEAAKSSMEAHAETRQEACKKFFVKQKELYEQEMKPDLEAETGPRTMLELLSKSNVQGETGKALVVKPADNKTCVASSGGSLPNVTAEEDQTRAHDAPGAVEIVGAEVRQPNTSADITREEDQTRAHDAPVAVEIVRTEVRQPDSSADVASSSENTTVDKMGFTEEIPPDVLAQMMQEIKKQARLEEQSQLDALTRDRAMLEKELEAREKAEHASVSQGHQ